MTLYPTRDQILVVHIPIVFRPRMKDNVLRCDHTIILHSEYYYHTTITKTMIV